MDYWEIRDLIQDEVLNTVDVLPISGVAPQAKHEVILGYKVKLPESITVNVGEYGLEALVFEFDPLNSDPMEYYTEVDYYGTMEAKAVFHVEPISISNQKATFKIREVGK